MKTQSWGSCSSRRVSRMRRQGPWADALAEQVYRAKRENGLDTDSPASGFPYDGEFKWIKGTVKGDYVYGVKENDGYYHYEVRYDEGPGDKKWMEKKDRNYLARLHLLGANNDVERQDLKENKRRAIKAAEEIKKLPLNKIPQALKKYEEKRRSDEEEEEKKRQEEKKKKVEELYKKGEEFHGREQYREAIIYDDKALENDPNHKLAKK